QQPPFSTKSAKSRLPHSLPSGLRAANAGGPLRAQLRTSMTRAELQRVCHDNWTWIGQSRHRLNELCIAADLGQQTGRRISALNDFGTKCLAATWPGETVARRQLNGACHG